MLQSDFFFAPTQFYVEIVPYEKNYFRHLGIHFLLVPAWIIIGRETQRRFPFGDSSLISLVPRNYFRWNLRWNFPASASELIPFGARSDRLCYLRSPEISSWGFLLVFPCWGLPWLFVREDYIFHCWGFTVILLSWGNTWVSTSHSNKLLWAIQIWNKSCAFTRLLVHWCAKEQMIEGHFCLCYPG